MDSHHALNNLYEILSVIEKSKRHKPEAGAAMKPGFKIQQVDQ